MSIISEGLLAVTGFVSPAIRASTLARAQAYPAKLAHRARDWVSGKARATWTAPEDQDPQKLLARFSSQPEEFPGQFSLPDELAAEWGLEVTEARASLVRRWPAVSLDPALGLPQPELPFDRACHWLSLVAVAEDPMRFMTNLEAGMVTPEECQLFREVYPELSEVIDTAVVSARADWAADAKRQAPPMTVQVSLAVWESREVAAPPQAAEGPPTEKPKKKSSVATVAPHDSLKTPSQRAG